MRGGLFAATLAAVLLGGATAEAAPKITTLSNRADLISGDDALLPRC
ncbi:MAG: hypothetical protein WKF94_00105 [Solirubrobacteraceae bacterium]